MKSFTLVRSSSPVTFPKLTQSCAFRITDCVLNTLKHKSIVVTIFCILYEVVRQHVVKHTEVCKLQLVQRQIKLQLVQHQIKLQLVQHQIKLQLVQHQIKLQLVQHQIKLQLVQHQIKLQLVQYQIKLQLVQH